MPDQYQFPTYDESVDVTAPPNYLETIPQPLTTQIDPALFANLSQQDLSQFMPQGPEQPPQDSAIDQLIKQLQPQKVSPYADAASVLGSYSQGQKANRISTGEMAHNYDQSMLAAQQGRNTTEADALKKLAQTKYLLGGGSKFNFAGNPYTYGGPPAPPSDAQKAGATALQAQLLKRLAEGGTYQPIPFSTYGTPGKAEKVSDWGAVAAGGLGVVDQMMKAKQAGEMASSIPYGKIASAIGSWFGR